MKQNLKLCIFKIKVKGLATDIVRQFLEHQLIKPTVAGIIGADEEDD